jgi:hypothetical protein
VENVASIFRVDEYAEQLTSMKQVANRAVLQFLNPNTDGRTPWTGDQPVVRPLPTQTQNKRRQTSMSCVGFEPTIPAFERAKTVHALDRAPTVIGKVITRLN